MACNYLLTAAILAMSIFARPCSAQPTGEDLHAMFLETRNQLSAELNRLIEDAVPITKEVGLSFGPYDRRNAQIDEIIRFKGVAQQPHMARTIVDFTTEILSAPNERLNIVDIANRLESIRPTTVEMSTGYDGISELIGASIITEIDLTGEPRSKSVKFPVDNDSNLTGIWPQKRINELSPLTPRFELLAKHATQGQSILRSLLLPKDQLHDTSNFKGYPPKLIGKVPCFQAECLVVELDEKLSDNSGDVEANVSITGFVLFEASSLRVQRSAVHVTSFANHPDPVTLEIITEFKILE
ncbi:MAG: hypothetical protein RIC16_13745 [Rhodospirillales bacterium]